MSNYGIDSINLKRFLVSNLRIDTQKLCHSNSRPSKLDEKISKSPSLRTKTYRLTTQTNAISSKTNTQNYNTRIDFTEKISEIANQITFKDTLNINDMVILDNILNIFTQIIGNHKVTEKIVDFIRSYIYFTGNKSEGSYSHIISETGSVGYTYRDYYISSDAESRFSYQKSQILGPNWKDNEHFGLKLFFAKLRESKLYEKAQLTDKLKHEIDQLRRDLKEVRTSALKSQLEVLTLRKDTKSLLIEEKKLKNVEEKLYYLNNDYSIKTNKYLDTIVDLKSKNNNLNTEITALKSKYTELLENLNSLYNVTSKTFTKLESISYSFYNHTLAKGESLESRKPNPKFCKQVSGVNIKKSIFNTISKNTVRSTGNTKVSSVVNTKEVRKSKEDNNGLISKESVNRLDDRAKLFKKQILSPQPLTYRPIEEMSSGKESGTLNGTTRAIFTSLENIDCCETKQMALELTLKTLSHAFNTLKNIVKAVQ